MVVEPVMFRKRSTPATPRRDSNATERGVDFAWRTHTAITDWTAKVDGKASIVLSLGSLLLGFMATLSTPGRALADLQGWRAVVEGVGVALVALGVLLTALVVAPRLSRRRARKTWRSNFVYFGHLRRWEPEALKQRLLSLDTDQELSVLASQLVTTSKIAWYKHSMLQFAMTSLGLGAGLTALSVMWP
jgi:Family of unknown function (DUF5706)